MNDNQTRRRLIIAAAVSAFAGFIVCFPLTNTDIWWHCAAGREMVRTGGLLFSDPFSFTPAYDTWINAHWLFQLGAYFLFQGGGVAAVVAAKCVLFSIAVFLLYTAIPGARANAAAIPVFGILLYEVRYLVLARPVIVTLVCSALVLFLLERYRRNGKMLLLACTIPVQILWTNCQGLFVLGPVIFGAYCIEQLIAVRFGKETLPSRSPKNKQAQIQGLFFLLVILACLATPYGIEGFLFPFRLFTRIDPSHSNLYAYNVSENLPLAALVAREPRLAVTVVGAAVTAVICFMGTRASLRVSHVLLYCAFLSLAVMAKRNILLFSFVMAPILSHHAEGLLNRIRTKKRETTVRRAVVLFGICLFILYFLSHAAILRISSGTGFLSPFRYPDGAVRWMRNNPVRGNVFNAIRYGGYLLWNRYPPKKAFIDGRLIIRPPSFFAEYLAILDNPALFEPVRKRFDITHVCIPTAVFYRYMKLCAFLYRDPAWSLVYADGAAALFVRTSLAAGEGIDMKDPDQVAEIRTMLEQRWAANHHIRREALHHLDRFVSTLGEN